MTRRSGDAYEERGERNQAPPVSESSRSTGVVDTIVRVAMRLPPSSGGRAPLLLSVAEVRCASTAEWDVDFGARHVRTRWAGTYGGVCQAARKSAPLSGPEKCTIS